MTNTGDVRVSQRGQMSLPASARHRWGLDSGGEVGYLDIGDAVILIPGGVNRLRRQLLEAVTRRTGIVPGGAWATMNSPASDPANRRPAAWERLEGENAASPKSRSFHNRVLVCPPLPGCSRVGRDSGTLSAPFASLRIPRDRAIQALLEYRIRSGLSASASLLRHRAIANRHDLNILGMEVLAAAVHLEADVYLSAPSPRLQKALIHESRRAPIMSQPAPARSIKVIE